LPAPFIFPIFAMGILAIIFPIVFKKIIALRRTPLKIIAVGNYVVFCRILMGVLDDSK
jgi:hypothetical protein